MSTNGKALLVTTPLLESKSELTDQIFESATTVVDDVLRMKELADDELALAHGTGEEVEAAVQRHIKFSAAFEAFQADMVTLMVAVDRRISPNRKRGKLPPGIWKTADGTQVCSCCHEAFDVGDRFSTHDGDALHGFCILRFCVERGVMP